MSLLTIVQKTCRRLSLAAPSVVVTSTDAQVLQLWELANEAGDDMARDFDWQMLRKEQTFVTVATPEQSNVIPSDFSRFISDSFFNRSTRRQLFGPITPQQWQAIQAQPQLNRIFLAYVERNGAFLVTPTPTAGETIAFEYVSNQWCQSATAVGQSEFLADTDTGIISERLLILSLRWRFLQAKGLDYAEALRTYEVEIEKTKGRDGGNTIINVTGEGQYILSPNLPEGSFPGP